MGRKTDQATRETLTRDTARQSGYRQDVCKEAIDKCIGFIVECLYEGKSVRLWELGRFDVRERKERHARDIVRGYNIVLPKHVVVWYKPYKEFLEKCI